MKKEIFGLISAAVLACTSVPPASAAEDESAGYPVKGKTPDGRYIYEVTNDYGEGEIFFDGAETDDGTFSCKWDSVRDATFSKGLDLSKREKSYSEYGDIECDYAIEYAPKGISHYGIHGWVESKESYDCGIAEFFIIEGYSTWRPWSGGGMNTKRLGTVRLNGYLYEIYSICCTDSLDAPTSPSQVRYQYVSIVTPEYNPVPTEGSALLSHRISLDEHFKAWESAGIDMSGVLREVSFWVFGAQSSGEAKVTKNELTFKYNPDKNYRLTGKSPDGTYDYEVWNEGRLGTVSFDGARINGGAFTCRWNDTRNSIFLKGRKPDPAAGSTYKDFDKISCSYAMDYQAQGISYYGIYGQIQDSASENTETEFNIVEGYIGWEPPGNARPLTTVTIDGREYHIYEQHVPLGGDLVGGETRIEYWSVISEKDNPASEDQPVSVRSRISIKDHFAAWDKAGMVMSGILKDVSFQIWNWQSSGYAAVSQNEITLGSSTKPVPEFTNPAKPESFADGSGEPNYQKTAKSANGCFAAYGEAMNPNGLGETALDGTEQNSGAFSCKWNSAESCFFQKGPVIPEAAPYKAFGHPDCDYALEYTPQGTSWFGMHGWVESNRTDAHELAEFYIVDGFSDWRPNDCETPLASVTADGCTYDIYRTIHTGAGSPLYQYWSVIRSEDNQAAPAPAAPCRHHISMDKHFEAWENAGIDMSGKISELAFFVEGCYSSGEATLSKNEIRLGSEPGDLSGDGMLDHEDAEMLQSYLINKAVGLENLQSADLNGDGILNAADLSLLKQKLLR